MLQVFGATNLPGLRVSLMLVARRLIQPPAHNRTRLLVTSPGELHLLDMRAALGHNFKLIANGRWRQSRPRKVTIGHRTDNLVPN